VGAVCVAPVHMGRFRSLANFLGKKFRALWINQVGNGICTCESRSCPSWDIIEDPRAVRRASKMRGMQFQWPHVEKFISLPVCFGLVGAVLATFFVLLIALATTARKRDEEND
jgi:hypothetical protein